jgi:hypothetical protein
MTIKRAFILAGLAIVILFVVCRVRNKINYDRDQAKFDKIELRMTKTKVESIMGKPIAIDTSQHHGIDYEVWTFKVPSNSSELPEFYFQADSGILIYFWMEGRSLGTAPWKIYSK